MDRKVQPRKEDYDSFPIADDAEEEKRERKRGRKVVTNDGSPQLVYQPRYGGYDADDPEFIRRARKSGKLAKWKGEDRSKSLDIFISGQIDRARKKYGHRGVYNGTEADNLVLVIPAPSLAFEFLIAQNGFPLSVIIQLVSEAGIGKSALLAEFGRWFFDCGGGFALEENETKFNSIWYRSILHNFFDDKTIIYRCESVEDWQRKLTFQTNDTKQFMLGTKAAPGPGRTFPFLMGVDSVMGKQSEEVTEKIIGSKLTTGNRSNSKTTVGHAERAFPVEAQLISKYLRAYASELDNWPFSLVLVNHLKNQMRDGVEERHRGGGKLIEFQESFEIELIKHGGPRKIISCADFEGYPISLVCWKNSFGPGKRRILTRLLWWYEDDPERPGKWEQHTVWDWDWSTVWLLNNILRGDKVSTILRNSLKDTGFHLECTSEAEIENSAWSESLGMKESDAVPWSQLGEMIRNNKEWMPRLRQGLRIYNRPIFKGDYLDQINALSATLP